MCDDSMVAFEICVSQKLKCWCVEAYLCGDEESEAPKFPYVFEV